MEIRLLRYFLTVAQEKSYTKAAKKLHITQPTLSMQLSAFEKDLGLILFDKSKKSISLTDEGLILKRRVIEILELEEKTLEEIKNSNKLLNGSITFGCGEFSAVEILAKICKKYKKKYPLIQISIHTAAADDIYEMINNGSVDIGLFMEAVDTQELDYIRIKDSDHWVVSMPVDDELSKKEYIKKEDLLDKPLILPERLSIQSELANWFGEDFKNLNISFLSNISTNAAVIAKNKLAYLISIEGAVKYWRDDILVQKNLNQRYPQTQ